MRKGDFELGMRELMLIVLFIVAFVIIVVLLLNFVEPASTSIFGSAQQMEGAGI